MTQQIRNIAIIAHVDHGKTTLVDQHFRQSGMFRDNQQVADAVARSVGIDRALGNLMPEDKVTTIRELQAAGDVVEAERCW